MLYSETDPEWCELAEEEIKERRFILDAAFVYLQAAMEDISVVLKGKYPEDMKRPHNSVNF